MVLKVENLITSFRTASGSIRAVDGVSFEIAEGKTLGIVGESGCGKTVTALSLMRLIQEPPGKIESGKIILNGTDILQLPKSDMQKLRGSTVSMIFQEPMTSLNPVFTVGDQIQEAILLHQKVSQKEARSRCIEMMELVGIPDPEQRIDYYPHQMSGGLRQRIMIAMALSCRPKLLIADEPTTALDVTIQAQILQLIKSLKEQLKMAVIIITHDFGIIAEMADEVAVMYAGKVVEQGPVAQIFDRPQHPYTIGLQNSIPTFVKAGQPLYNIPGMVPDLRSLGIGCRFAARCEFKSDNCLQSEPPLVSKAENPHHSSACFYPRNLA